MIERLDPENIVVGFIAAAFGCVLMSVALWITASAYAIVSDTVTAKAHIRYLDDRLAVAKAELANLKYEYEHHK